MVGQVGFQSHSFYLVLGSYFKRLMQAGDTTELDLDQAEINQPNQPNQPSLLGNGVKTKLPAMNMVAVSRTGPRVVSRDADGMID